MDINTHAALMAQICRDDFGRLILQIPDVVPDLEIARQAIATVSHASGMAKGCGSSPSADMILSIAEKLCQTMKIESFGTQDDGVNKIIQSLAHVSSMARITPEKAGDMYACIKPIVEQQLPSTEAEANQLSRELKQVDATLRQLSHAAMMTRIART